MAPHTVQLKAWASPEMTTSPPLIGSALSSISDCKYQTCLIFSILCQAASGMDRSGAAANEKQRVAGSIGGRVLHNLTATQPSSQTDPLFFLFFWPFYHQCWRQFKTGQPAEDSFFFCLIFLTEVTIHLTSICESVRRRIVTANSRFVVSYSGPLACMFKFYTVT